MHVLSAQPPSKPFGNTGCNRTAQPCVSTRMHCCCFEMALSSATIPPRSISSVSLIGCKTQAAAVVQGCHGGQTIPDFLGVQPSRATRQSEAQFTEQHRVFFQVETLGVRFDVGTTLCRRSWAISDFVEVAFSIAVAPDVDGKSNSKSTIGAGVLSVYI
mmetsp:Transcript_83821/g.233822  ORF Transcript_83821/g.233822 Transcript_83821/m.233822 type:complete len:159 (+) Transcript_83821:814-1290(+)